MVWLASGDMDVTLDLNLKKARMFEEKQLPEYLENATGLVAYEVNLVLELVESHVTKMHELKDLHWKPEPIAG